ncbi:MAG TPA: flippase-like domain-containing protein [Chloroflexi bacterium]|jgi:uncharacterized protein (TIRG00374 family)|nr:flippase-like domain-containing protein [Chloroflexota bacterium]
MMPKTEKTVGLNQLVSVGLPLAISFFALWLVFRKLDFQALLSAFGQLSFGSVTLIVLCFLAGLLLRGITCWIIYDSKFSYADVFWAMNLGYLLNSIVPLRLGEFGRAAFLSEKNSKNTSYMEVLAGIVAERILDLLVGFCFLIACLLFLIDNVLLNRIAWVGLAGLAISIILIILAAQNKEKTLSWLKTKFNSNLAQQKLIPAFNQLLIGFEVFLDPRRFLLAFVILAISWSFSMVEYMILQNVILSAWQWWWPMLVIPASAFVNALPAAPSGLGIYEAGSVGAYALVGVAKAPALAMSLVVHAVQIFIPAVFGVIALFLSGESLGSLTQKATNFRQKRREQV